MKQRLPLIGLTILLLIIGDLVVISGLAVMNKIGGPFTSIVTYFNYGRSVPGKHAAWEKTPDTPGNLYAVAWRDDVIARSVKQFTASPSHQPVLRSYGMSFLNDITRSAEAQREGLIADRHAGPAASPNFVYSVYQDDANNRRPGDIAVIGILSSSVAAMATMSNSSWLFEQPAPFTYPIYSIDKNNNLIRTNPVVETLEQHRALKSNAALAKAWAQQRAGADAYYHPITHGFTWADISPFGRLVRRYAATYFLTKTEQALLGTGEQRNPSLDYENILLAMLTEFSATARAEGITPIVVLIQTQGNYPDLNATLGDQLTAAGVPFLATNEYHSPLDRAGFKRDGHFKTGQNEVFGAALLALIDQEHAQKP